MDINNLSVDDLVMVTLDTTEVKKGDIGFIRSISNNEAMFRKENEDNEVCIEIDLLEKIDYPF